MTELQFVHISTEHHKEDNIKEYIDSISNDKVFYDLGANLGWFALYAANKGLTTYAFEVDKSNFQGLTENLNNNPHLNNIFTFNKGIADKKQIVNLRIRDPRIGAHHKTLDLPDYCGQPNIINSNHIEVVEVDSLDNIIEENNLPFPDHLKVDIDGSEYAFIMGSPKVLSYAQSLVIELVTNNDYYDKIISILEDNNFILSTIYDIPNEKNLKNIVFTKNVE